MYAKHNTPQQKLELAHAWRVHLQNQNQYLDRQINWSLRPEVLTIIIDSMDKKKLCGPNGGLTEIEQLGARPRVVVTAALAHGHVTAFFLAPDELTHGADAYCEVLCQVVDEITKARGPQLPKHLVLQVDNTVAQAKNGFVGTFCAYLVGNSCSRQLA